MIRDLLMQFEQKVEHAVDLIELLRMQIEELEEENNQLRTEQEKWRDDLVGLLKRFDQIDPTEINQVNQNTIEEQTLETIQLDDEIILD